MFIYPSSSPTRLIQFLGKETGVEKKGAKEEEDKFCPKFNGERENIPFFFEASQHRGNRIDCFVEDDEGFRVLRGFMKGGFMFARVLKQLIQFDV